VRELVQDVQERTVRDADEEAAVPDEASEAGPESGPEAEPETESEAESEAGARTEPEPEPAPAPAPTRSRDARLIDRTLAEAAPHTERLIGYFYAVLFTEHPELRLLFPAAMDLTRDRLLATLLEAARLIDDRPALTRLLAPMGRGHRRFGTLPEHYPPFGRALLAALRRYASSTWSADAEAAWARAHQLISEIMMRAAANSELSTPPWWQAEVVKHELRAEGVAVLTLRPDHPYPFRAGQYLSLETPCWPRVWRHYSLSCAPRADNTLEIQVKRVPAGWVSGALVDRTRPGDVLRLGAAEGSMVVAPDSGDRVLCLAGGTGIAPLKAIVEDLVTHSPRRRVELFYGARSAQDLYELPELTALAERCAWLSLRPVAARRPFPGLCGRLPDVVRHYGPFPDTDAVLSGPPEMLRRATAMLLGQGVPRGRLLHDPVDAMGTRPFAPA
jgi:NAD(P)H-flavin reductase/hemoglobin-like flavoprotein